MKEYINKMTLDEVLQYEDAAVANKTAEKEKPLAVAAMEEFYSKLGLRDDPVIQGALEDAAAGGEENISHIGILRAIQTYGGKYDKAFKNTKLSELNSYLTDGLKLSDEYKEEYKKYEGLTYKEIEAKTKDENTSKEEKEELKKYLGSLGILLSRRLEKVRLKMIEKNAERTVNKLFEKEEKKKK